MPEVDFDEVLDALLARHDAAAPPVPAPPAPATTAPAPMAAATSVAAPVAVAEPRADGSFKSATVLVGAVILLNVVLQYALATAARHSRLDLSRSLLLVLGTGLLFYGVVGIAAIVGLNDLGVRPSLVVGAPSSAIARGVVTGGGIGLALALIGRAAGVGDPLSSLIASDGHTGVLLVAVLAVVLIGPAVEELVFRGLFAETLRGRGRGAAIWISAAAFSLAHLQLAQFRYFVWMGAVLGAIWWRRGLVASIGAHAAFNGALLAVAVVGAHGPAVTLHSDVGAAWRVPAAWHAVKAPDNEDLAAVGPHGATIEVAHIDGGAAPSLDALAAGLRSGIGPGPGMVVDTASVRSATVAGRPAVAVRTVGGPDASMVFVADGTRRWVVVSQHLDDATFTDLLTGLTLPAGP